MSVDSEAITYGGRTAWARNLAAPVRSFLSTEEGGAIVMLGAAIAALVWANAPGWHWTVLGALAHNLLRWTQLIGLPDTTVRAARTLRRRLVQIAGRLTRHGRSWTLHLPARWPWHGDYITALARIRALPTAT